jgi:hypothetical protein
MAVESVPLAHARASGEFLDQYLVDCPVCAKPAAAHVGRAEDGQRVLVRFVCVDSCDVLAADVLANVPASIEVSLSA